MVVHRRRVLLLFLLGAIKCRADLDPVWSILDEDTAENTMMPNERETLADCHLRFYKQGGRGIVGPAFAKPAFLREFAHIGAIGWTRADGGIEWACGGSLIWNNFIVTAAHCTANDDNVAPDVVRFGDLNLDSDEDDEFAQQLRIVNIIRHPLYRFSGKYYDIALMQLERNVSIHETVAPACLWLDEEVRFTELESAGWGKTGFAERKTPILLKISLKPLDNDNCAAHYNPTTTRGLRNGLDRHHICAGDAQMDTCPGDSGGPLHVRLQHSFRVTPFLVGLTSFGLPCGQSHPGVYTKLAPFGSWILETLQSNGAPEVTVEHFQPADCALRYVGLRQLAVSRVVANESGVFETFDHTRQYIEHDYMGEVVQLRWPNATSARDNCMGSIIDHDTILTLGDCATHEGVPPSQVIHRARSGRNPSLDLEIDRSYDVREIHVHPNHTDGSFYDNLAIVKLNGSIEGQQPACIRNAPDIPGREIELFARGRTDLNVYQYKDKVIYDSSPMHLAPRVYTYANDNCTLARQYRDKLDQGLLDQHLCFANDPFLVPQMCDLTAGAPLQRNVWRLRRYHKYVYGLGLFGRDCGYGQPAVAVQLNAHLPWLESVLLPNRTRAPVASDAVMFINPDLELFDRCDFYEGPPGLCVPVERCRGVYGRIERSESLIFCTNGTIVCCLPNDVLDDADLMEGSQQIDDCEWRYEDFRRRNYGEANAENPQGKPHLAEVIWVDAETSRGTLLCLGYLITTDSVLTTALCVEIKDRRPNLVRLGYVMSRLDDSGVQLQLASILTHPEFNPRTGVNNVALLRLARPVKPSVDIFPACLWKNQTHTPLVSTLLSIENSVVSEDDVHPQYSSDCDRVFHDPLHGGQLCMVAAESGGIVGSCLASEPVYWRRKSSDRPTIEYLVALYSHGNCKATDGYIIGTRVAAYLPWIMENV